MQRLHVVGFTSDHQGLILSVRRGTKSGTFTVDVDSAFEEALNDLLKERGAESAPRIPRAESQLSVREMQQRLRSGQSIRQVARAAGVDDEWVARFAIPIQAEQGQVVRQAFELVMSKQRLGLSSQPLGTSVWWNLQDKSVQLDEEHWSNGWSAALLRDSRWVVKLEYEARKRKQVAEWEVDLKAGTVISRNRLGSDLGYVESGRRRRPGPPPPTGGGLLSRPAPLVNEPPEPAPVLETDEAADAQPARRAVTRKSAAARKATARKATARKAAAKKTTARKAAATKSAAKKSTAAKKSAAKKSAAKKATAKKAPAKNASAKKATARKATPKKAPAKASAKKAAAQRPAATKSTATKRPAAAKPAAKRAPAKKAVARKAVATRPTAKRAPAKKKAAKRPAKQKPAPARVAQRGTSPARRVAVPSESNGGLRPTMVTPRISAVRALPAANAAHEPSTDPSPTPRPTVTAPPQPIRKRRGFFRR